MIVPLFSFSFFFYYKVKQKNYFSVVLLNDSFDLKKEEVIYLVKKINLVNGSTFPNTQKELWLYIIYKILVVLNVPD